MKSLQAFIDEDCKETLSKYVDNKESPYPALYGIARHWAEKAWRHIESLKLELAERDKDHMDTERQLSAIIKAGCECTECFRRVDETAYVDGETVLCDRCVTEIILPKQEEEERQERMKKDMRASA